MRGGTNAQRNDAVTIANLTPGTVSGLTITKNDNINQSLRAIRIGKIIIYNVSLTVSGTVSESGGWKTIVPWATSLLKTGETENSIRDISVPFGSSVLNFRDGHSLYLNNGNAVNGGLCYQFISYITGRGD